MHSTFVLSSVAAISHVGLLGTQTVACAAEELIFYFYLAVITKFKLLHVASSYLAGQCSFRVWLLEVWCGDRHGSLLQLVRAEEFPLHQSHSLLSENSPPPPSR